METVARFALIAALMWIGSSAIAAENQSKNLSCANGDFASDQATLGLAKVIGQGHLNFMLDADGCPSKPASCAGWGYVLPGDVLITSNTHGTHVCAFYPNSKGGTAGWVEQARLSPLPVDKNPPLRAWAGLWKDGDDTIRLSLQTDHLVAEGHAFWPSANPSADVAPGGPNVGDFNGQSKPNGNVVAFSEGDADYSCHVTLRLIGDVLVVSDNTNCGGMNVRFDGVYRRR
ncbi:hypothetical protein [Dyella nitratireducens]|uniref:Uncharacterized protein n=1 Tax=Dyella nitratireducens TaxID=1849580 RepID=A0ABQ1FP60_9GAMM|nr:hypothetical protein [Dyella nitratireducens]GGA24916.1 hypothetical protein GCM10010981_11750 [Dyella nitratireducens]GLQ43763.1 hypothetical protein GCM10007902_36130 [Dyella nitratireducens]